MPFPHPARPIHIAFTAALLVFGAGAGWVFSRIGTPLPYMMGSLLASAAFTMAFQTRFPGGYQFPLNFRHLFVGIIGVMIGAQVTPEILSLLPKMAVSIPAILLFVPLAHAANYAIFRRGGYDRPTAYYSGAPGGLIESISFGEEAGADIRVLTLMQFLRIIVVVTILPFAIALYEGAPVGSAAGLGGPGETSDLADVGLAFLFAAVGAVIGVRVKVPAGQLTVPLFLVAIASGFGWIDLTLPGWLIASAQVVLGVGLGLRFTGISRRMLVSGLGLSILSVVTMLLIGVGFSLAIHAMTGLSTETMIISFAPGGVTEMSLIALSLAMNPAFVTLHHLVRIIFTVVELAVVKKLGWIRP
ncbi:AbrB family transcriptional regulator [uncultured Maritimibacter sp.]|jgi:membrane AbrB-like protein|uniref:AbrB family transcriptional regulator n=1 Tax=uncultured Maritimibacter sp. TaxID=991866 RepID=UPI000B2F0B40|nr:AbrB family transcriptional regulator [uncultured Maritimibacter sp.]